MKKIGTIFTGGILALSCMVSPVNADDSEAFFEQIDPSLKIFPDVLFVLDTSGSMN